MTDTARVNATPLGRDLFPIEISHTDAEGKGNVEELTAFATVPFGVVSGYWLGVGAEDKTVVHSSKFAFLRAAMPADSFTQLCGLADTVLDEKAMDDVIAVLLNRYEQPPPRPSQPPKPSQPGRRNTGGGSKAKRRSPAKKASSTTSAGAGS